MIYEMVEMGDADGLADAGNTRGRPTPLAANAAPRHHPGGASTRRGCPAPANASPDRARLDSLILLRSRSYTLTRLALERHKVRAKAPLHRRTGKGMCAVR